jgi:hypothetical protein
LPEVGTLSADGSRRWDGRFWVPLRTDHPLDELPPLVARRMPNEPTGERGGLRLGGVILAAAVGLAISYLPIPMPNPGSLEGALNEIVFVSFIRSYGMFAVVVVILSIGRQGIDVLLLRSIVVAFILGIAFATLILSPIFFFSIPVNPRVPLPLVVVLGGVIWAGILGPIITIFAAVANLIWYRSFRSLRPQLRIRRRG